MAFDFDEGGSVSREGKWILLVVGLIVLCCLLTTCSYLLFKYLVKRRRIQKERKADEEEAEKWTKRCSLHRIISTEYGISTGSETDTDKPINDERDRAIPRLPALNLLIEVSNELIAENRRVKDLVESGVTHDGCFTRILLLAVNCEAETVSKDQSLLECFKPLQQYLRLNHSGASQVVVSSHLSRKEPTLAESEKALSQFVTDTEPTDFLLFVILNGDRHIGAPSFDIKYTYHLLKALDRGSTVLVVDDSHPGRDVPDGVTPSSVLTAQSNKYSFSESSRVSDANFSYIKCVAGQHDLFRTGNLVKAVTSAFVNLVNGSSFCKFSEFTLKVQRELVKETSDDSVAVQFGSTSVFAPNDTFDIIPRGQIEVDVISIGDDSMESDNSPVKNKKDNTELDNKSIESIVFPTTINENTTTGSIRRRKPKQQLPSESNSSGDGSKISVRPLRRPAPPRSYQPSEGINPLDDAFNVHTSDNASRLPGRNWMITDGPSSPPLVSSLVQKSKTSANRSWM